MKYLEPIEDFSQWWRTMADAGLWLKAEVVPLDGDYGWRVTLRDSAGEEEVFVDRSLPEAILSGYRKCVVDPTTGSTEPNVTAALQRMTDPLDYRRTA